MYKRSKIITLIILGIVLASCIHSESALIRVGNPLYKSSVKYDKSKSYVIVGVMGDLEIIQFMKPAALVDLRDYTIPTNNSTQNIDAHIFPINLGRKFAIQRIIYHDHNNFKVNTGSEVRIKKPFTLIPIKPGLYYYGTFYTKNRRMVFSRKLNQVILRIAKEKHPVLFRSISQKHY